MNEKKLKIVALFIVLILPVFFLLVFKPLSKIPRPKAPHKMFATGVKEIINDKGDKVMDSTYHTIPILNFQTKAEILLSWIPFMEIFMLQIFSLPPVLVFCPKMSNSLERVQEAFVKDRNFRIVSFSVDPARDTLQSLRRYADEHNAIPENGIFCAARKKPFSNLPGMGSLSTAKDDEDGGPEAFIHSEKLVLVDQTGNIRGYYSGVDTNRVSQLMGDIVLLLRDTEKGYNFNKKK